MRKRDEQISRTALSHVMAILALAGCVAAGALFLPTRQARADALPTATAYQNEGATWKAKGGKTYLYAARESTKPGKAKAKAKVKTPAKPKLKTKAKLKKTKVRGGLVQIGKSRYYFDADGVQCYGWKRVAPSYYAFFKRVNGKGAVMLKSRVVEGIELDRHGYAKLNRTNLAELELYVKANDLVEQIVEPRWSQKRKFDTCFDYFASYDHFSFSRPRTYRDYATQHVAYALDLLDPDKRTGDCDSWAVTFSYVCVALGYPDALYVTRGGHAWVQIDGLIYDPQWSVNHSRTYGIRYGDLPGKDPNRKYTYPHVTYRVFPADAAWTGAPVGHARLGKTRRILKFAGRRYYAGADGYAASSWARYGDERYYLKTDGTAATGSYRTKDGGKARWLVFRGNGALVRGNGSMIVTEGGKSYHVDRNGRALPGIYRGKFYLPTGEQAAPGVRLAQGKFYAIGENGEIDEDLTGKLNAHAVQGQDATALLSLLGEPKKLTESPSCLNYLGYTGTDRVYRYANFKVQTFACPELGEVYWAAY